ncbi:MAG TPA: hypothetical protein VNL36_03615 [Bacteroidota bacterium]|nr:hypothetical protein [Bacteroidota bacterium]
MTTQRLLIVIAIFLAQVGYGQPKQFRSEIVLSGNLTIDLSEQAKQSLLAGDTVVVALERKSGLQAAAFSILLPGAGEYYVGDYWKAGGFLAAEVGLWLVYTVYTSKGNDQTSLFEEYADKNWSVVKYAQWIEQYGPQLNPEAQGLSGLVTSNDPNLPPWDRVDWVRLNRAEMEIGKKTGTFFSHQLPRRPEQQYYELIGKYGQYNPGWADANVDASNFHSALTKMFLDYSQMRGEANNFYNIAGTAAKLVVLNHVLSALDAAWSAAMHNRSLTVKAHVQPVQRPFGIVEFVPTARVSLEF